ncbi:hypothetical protein NliqN6_0933 [Naganishia liquefaciens]|uniref:Transmembrane protein n=1 Tax=Naganishia liquefaciens TaxID=104408 RepID=A0A8H3TPH1_9TREE|nr:hypothetical protein NliqN6_0933 [Naganishia liquefaciens]
MLVSSLALQWLPVILFLLSSFQIRAHDNAKLDDKTMPFTISEHTQTSTDQSCPVLSVKEVSAPTTSPLHISGATETPGQATSLHHTESSETDRWSHVTVTVVCPPKAEFTLPVETIKIEVRYDDPSALSSATLSTPTVCTPQSVSHQSRSSCSAQPTSMPSTGFKPFQTLWPNNGRSLDFEVPNLCPATDTFSERCIEVPTVCEGPLVTATAFVLVPHFYLDYVDVLGERDLEKLRCERKIFREEVRLERSKRKAQRNAQTRSRYIVNRSIRYFWNKQRSDLDALTLYVPPSRWQLEQPNGNEPIKTKSTQETPDPETGQIQLLLDTPIDNLSYSHTPANFRSKEFLRCAFLQIKGYMNRFSSDCGGYSLEDWTSAMRSIETGVSRHFATIIWTGIAAAAVEFISSKITWQFDPQIASRRSVGLVVLLVLIALDIVSKAVPRQVGYFFILLVLRHLSSMLKQSSNAPASLIAPWIYLELSSQFAFDAIRNAVHRFTRFAEHVGWQIVMVAIITSNVVRQLRKPVVQPQYGLADSTLSGEIPFLRQARLPQRRDRDPRYTPRPCALFDNKMQGADHARRWTRTTRNIDDD